MRIAAALGIVAMIAACSGQTSPGKGGSGGDSGSGSGSGSSSGSASSSSSGGSGSSSGVTGSSSGTGFGCMGGFATMSYPVKATLCEPQLASTTSCTGQVCSWTAEIPCEGDAGGFDAGDCMAACTMVAPQGAGPAGFCQVFPATDGGTSLMITCGGCGV